MNNLFNRILILE